MGYISGATEVGTVPAPIMATFRLRALIQSLQKSSRWVTYYSPMQMNLLVQRRFSFSIFFPLLHWKTKLLQVSRVGFDMNPNCPLSEKSGKTS